MKLRIEVIKIIGSKETEFHIFRIAAAMLSFIKMLSLNSLRWMDINSFEIYHHLMKPNTMRTAILTIQPLQHKSTVWWETVVKPLFTRAQLADCLKRVVDEMLRNFQILLPIIRLSRWRHHLHHQRQYRYCRVNRLQEPPLTIYQQLYVQPKQTPPIRNSQFNRFRWSHQTIRPSKSLINSRSNKRSNNSSNSNR